MEMNEVILETERLRLRWLREDDFEQYAKVCRDPEVMRFLGGQVLNDIEIYRQMAYFMGHWYFRLRRLGRRRKEYRQSGGQDRIYGSDRMAGV